MLIHKYTHIDTVGGRRCRIIKWGLPRSIVRAEAMFDMGEDEYEQETRYLEAITSTPVTDEIMNDEFEVVYAGHLYSEDAKQNAKWWFKQGFIRGANAN